MTGAGQKRRREQEAREGFKVSILSILFLKFVYNIYPRIGASEGACRFGDYQGDVQVEGRLPALPGRRVLSQPPRQTGFEPYRDVVDVLDQALNKKVDTVEDVIKPHNVEHAPAVQNDKDEEGGGGTKAKMFAVGMETTPEEFLDVVSRNEDEALKALSAEDLTEVFEFVCLSFALP